MHARIFAFATSAWQHAALPPPPYRPATQRVYPPTGYWEVEIGWRVLRFHRRSKNIRHVSVPEEEAT
jgi:hypothetical protein